MIFPARARVVATSGLPLSLLPELWLVEEMALVDDVDSNRRGSNLSVPQPGQFRNVLARHVEQPDLVLEEDPVECVAEAGPSIFVLIDTQRCRVDWRGLLVRDRCQPLDILQGLRVPVPVLNRDSKHDPDVMLIQSLTPAD